MARTALCLSSSPEWKRAYWKDWSAKNPDKVAEYRRRHKAKNPDYGVTYHRFYNIKKKYGLSQAAWEKLFESQDRKCAVCKSPEPKGLYWHVDHFGPLPCTPKEVRGILCCLCNHAAGKGTWEDISKLRALASYLEKFLCAYA